MSAFKIGDWVYITQYSKKRTPDFQNAWVDHMDPFVGNGIKYKIAYIKTNGISLANTGYNWPPAALTLETQVSSQDLVKKKIAYLWNKSNYRTKMVTSNVF